MNTAKIKAFDKKVKTEVQKAVDAIYKKHNKAMIALIAAQIPKGQQMRCGNGMALLGDKSGRAWGIASMGEDVTLNYLSSLQYFNDFKGTFDIPDTIKGKKLV